MTAARITGFGMTVDGRGATGTAVAITGAGASSAPGGPNPVIYGEVLNASRLGGDINIAQLGNIADVCFMAGYGTANNCNGGGAGGLTMASGNNFTSQVISLTFASGLSRLDLSSLFVRYQSLAGSSFGSSGVGVGTIVTGDDPIDPGGNDVPEPASWAMLIAGFGLVGAVARRRRIAAA